MMVSASRDKTVKIWSVPSASPNRQQSVCTRTHVHKKAVLSAKFVRQDQHILSADASSVHQWDIETGAVLQHYNGASVAISNIDCNSNIVIATPDATVRFLDSRSGQVMHEWRTCTSNFGPIKSLVVDEDRQWLAVTFAVGQVSLLDLRTGLLYLCWKAHEGEITASRYVYKYIRIFNNMRRVIMCC